LHARVRPRRSSSNHTCTDLPALEARHRQRARCEDRIRDAKDTGLTNLPYADAASNPIWLQIILLAMDLTTWAQPTGPGHQRPRRTPETHAARPTIAACRSTS
jgi:hypothetical protein